MAAFLRRKEESEMILVDDKYKLKYHSKPELLQLGFHYSGYDSNNDGNSYYSITFPVYKYNNHTTVECCVTTDILSGLVDFEVYQKSSRIPYIPFYLPEERYAYSDKFLKTMENNILKEFERMYIEPCK